jgi:hypothetical protein
MKRKDWTVHARMSDVLTEPGSPFVNWAKEVQTRSTAILTSAAILLDLFVSQCAKCDQVDSVLWFRTGDHTVCRRLPDLPGLDTEHPF